MQPIQNASRGVSRKHLGSRWLNQAYRSRGQSQYQDTSKTPLSTSAPLRDASFESKSGRLSQDAPKERSVHPPKAFRSTAQPDYILNPRFRSHPIPRFDGEGVPPLSLLVENGELKFYDEAENQSTRVSGRWLRDNCSCSQCRNIDTAQRQINVLKVGEVVNPCNARSFTLSRQGDLNTKITNYDIRGDHVTRTWGFCFVDDMPATPEATEALLESIGPIRVTHYGGFYDFTSDLSSKDTAYTSEALEPHTDNTYFTEPAGIQALHMLSHTDGSGGESSLVDGFGAAVQLYVEDREAYLTLSDTGVYTHASGNEGISIQPSQPFPTLSHDPEHHFLTQVRWNNADRAGVATDFASIDTWYDAAARFDKILSDQKNQYWFQLKPGQTLLFDNWRVLHGRTAFTGKRRMCGGYINRDDFISKYRMTSMTADDMNFSTVTG
ncbi:Trimethyllysine dioxygenase [Lecanosticta acicola]|uniref:Trimethyllysine dioxygenase n=1 Tax=Lecanosticta acicola TaxID=111012 RepID=A0AAI8Z151_9PEZI|nr:Trimethyllysine dioxygenase [Lecanosticta acicola]